MSRPVNPLDVLDGRRDADGDFARDEGMAAYEAVAARNPDRTVEASAKLAAGVAMIATGRIDVNLRRTTEAIVGEVASGLPEMDKVVDGKGE